MNPISGSYYASPNKFTVKQRLALALLPPLTAVSIKTLMSLCRHEILYRDRWDQAFAQHNRILVAIWHESLAFAAWRHKYSQGHTLVSYSFDGELASRILKHFGIKAIRGSSSRGGSQALHGLAEAARHFDNYLGFTLDGPRGPRRVAKPGIAILAARTGLPIIPQAFAAHPAWRLNSWDKFLIPKPFAKIQTAYGPLIPPPVDDSPEAIEATRLQVETELNRLQDELDGSR